MPLPRNPRLSSLARALRKQMTKQEKRLWYDFLRTFPVQFNRQKVIDDFIVDFYCHSAHLVVELDGGQHFEPETFQKDIERTKRLNSLGLKVLRFTNNEVDHNFIDVCATIQETVESALRAENTH